ncbi:hypothetical protein CEP53_002401 [Fusarium sp. AF-6]|nr:hypothetical protein CEP53_002401 [Fusarium sp. AF-6]
MQKVSQKVQAVSIALGGFREKATDLMALSMDSLPVPMIFLGEALAVIRDDWPIAQRLATISLRKSRGKGNLFEAASLLDIAFATYLQNGKNWGDDVEDILWQALGILDQLPPQPQVQYYKFRALACLTGSLIGQGKEVAKETACRLRDLIGKERKKTDNRMWEYFLCNTTSGMQWRISCLCGTAWRYLCKGNCAEAASWAGEAVAVGERSGYTRYLGALPLVVQREAFYALGDTQKCIAVSLKILDLLEPSEGPHRCIQHRTQYRIGESLARQGDVEEARSWYCKAADGAISLPTDEQHPLYTEDIDDLPDLATDLALFGEHYAEVGDLTAAEVVLSDAASRYLRYLGDFSLHFSTGLTLASMVFLYRRRFPQRRVLLLSANEAWKNSPYPNLYNIFLRESSFATTFTEDAELLRELSAASDLQASFVHQAYEHLTRARDANDELGEGDPDDLDKDATEEQEERQKTIVDLEDRLKLLGSETLPPKVTDGNQDVTKGNRNLRRVKSLQLPGTSRPMQRRLSLQLY